MRDTGLSAKPVSLNTVISFHDHSAPVVRCAILAGGESFPSG